MGASANRPLKIRAVNAVAWSNLIIESTFFNRKSTLFSRIKILQYEMKILQWKTQVRLEIHQARVCVNVVL